MKKITFCLLLLISLVGHSQEQKPKLNLNLEKFEGDNSLPIDWFQWGTYKVLKDSMVHYSGKYSVSIESNDNKFSSLAMTLPQRYKGKVLKLEGYMKMTDVKKFAGLLLRVDKDQNVVEFNNMASQNIKGTSDWVKYSVSLPNHEDADAIFIGGIITGEGKVWFDDFKVYIDDKDIETLQPIERVASKAKKDSEFDKSSKFQLDKVNQEQINNLYLLGKKWGYLKYHHSKIASGDYNFDYELFRALPIIKSSQFNSKLTTWVNSYGKTGEIKKNGHYYINMASGVGNPVFDNEKEYSTMNWNDDGYKLLALFRYWNMIEYFFPYKDIIGKDWDSVLKEYIPIVLEANDELSYKLALTKLITEVQDTHAITSRMGGVTETFYGKNIGLLKIKIIDGEVVVLRLLNGTPSDLNIKAGDIITKINGVDVQQIIDQRRVYTSASNEATKLRNICYSLLRTNDTSLSLTIKRNENEVHGEKLPCVVIKAGIFEDSNLTSHKSLENSIGYIYPELLKKNQIHDIMREFKDRKGIVIDLRCYPSDFIVFSLGKYLMPQPTEFVKFSVGSVENPGQFTISKPLKVGENNSSYFNGKIAILINESTQSNAEYTTMALRVAPQAKVFGSQTAGADGNVSSIVLPGNVKTMISGIGIFYPDGRGTQRIGIVPDVKIEPTTKGIKANKDEVLDRAIRYIETGE